MDNLMSFLELSHALGARVFAGEGKHNVIQSEGFSSVSLDSRSVIPGALFVALRGSVCDGHGFVEAAFRAGASGALVAFSALEEAGATLRGLAEKWGRVLVAVPDTLKGLQKAAAAYLKCFPGLVKIGITGSSGKTTTKEIAAAIIGREKSVVMNKGNLNSETGLPLSIFEVRPHHEVGVFEAGMNRPGEIAELAEVLNPRFALVTNVGSAHIGILGSRGAIAEEKKKIFSLFSGNNTALIPEDDDYRDFLAKDVRGRVVFYGMSTFPGKPGDAGLEGTEIVWGDKTVRFGLPGKFNFLNAVAAAALARELGIGFESIRSGLESVKPLFGRGEILKGPVTVIRDCYNANPESAAAALDFCDSVEWPGRRVYVIGSMLELGSHGEEAHAALGRRLLSCKAAMIFLFGEELLAAAEVLKKARNAPAFFHTVRMEELSETLGAYVKDGDLVLLKGSRGCALESLADTLSAKGGASVS